MEETIKRLELEIQFLKDKVERLERESIGQSNELYELMNIIEQKQWAHPNSCVHNSDPWEIWKYK